MVRTHWIMQEIMIFRWQGLADTTQFTKEQHELMGLLDEVSPSTTQVCFGEHSGH